MNDPNHHHCYCLPTSWITLENQDTNDHGLSCCCCSAFLPHSKLDPDHYTQITAYVRKLEAPEK